MQSCLFTIVGCLKSEEKEPTSGFPESSIITPSHPYRENFSCCITMRWESQWMTFWRIELLLSRHRGLMAWSALATPRPLYICCQGQPTLYPCANRAEEGVTVLPNSSLPNRLKGESGVRGKLHPLNRPRGGVLLEDSLFHGASGQGGPHAALGPWWSTLWGLTFRCILEFP
jgi:hypothetical protein